MGQTFRVCNFVHLCRFQGLAWSTLEPKKRSWTRPTRRLSAESWKRRCGSLIAPQILIFEQLLEWESQGAQKTDELLMLNMKVMKIAHGERPSMHRIWCKKCKSLCWAVYVRATFCSLHDHSSSFYSILRNENRKQFNNLTNLQLWCPRGTSAWTTLDLWPWTSHSDNVIDLTWIIIDS